MERQIQKPGVKKWFGDKWIKLQDQIFKAIEEGIIGEAQNCVLSGCSTSFNGVNYDIAPGIVWIDGKICIFEEVLNVPLPLYVVPSFEEADFRAYANNTIDANELNYLTKGFAVSQGVSELVITQIGTPYISNVIINGEGVIEGIPKTDLLNFNSSTILATAKAIFDLKAIVDGKEPAFLKGTAFNKNFGNAINTVAEGNHQHTTLYRDSIPRVQSNPTGAYTFGSHEATDIRAYNQLRSDNILDLDDLILDNITNIPQVADGIEIRTKRISIGIWDMNSTASVIIPHGISHTQVLGCDVVIISDNGETQNLTKGTLQNDTEQNGYWDISPANLGYIRLTRALNGEFDNAAFDSVAINRGYITLRYINN